MQCAENFCTFFVGQNRHIVRLGEDLLVFQNIARVIGVAAVIVADDPFCGIFLRKRCRCFIGKSCAVVDQALHRVCTTESSRIAECTGGKFKRCMFIPYVFDAFNRIIQYGIFQKFNLFLFAQFCHNILLLFHCESDFCFFRRACSF